MTVSRAERSVWRSHQGPSTGPQRGTRVPEKRPISRHSTIPSREKGGWATHTTNAEEFKLGQEAALTSFGLSPLSGTAETHRKFSRFGSGRERPGKRPGRALGLGRNGPPLAGSAPSNVAFCYFKLRVLAPEPWITTFTKPCISCSRNTSTSPGPLVLISHGRRSWGQDHRCLVATRDAQ